MESSEFLTVADVAAQLSLNEQTIRNMIDRGDLDAYHVGRRVRIRRSDLEAFLIREPVVPTKVAPPEPVPLPSPNELLARERLSEAARRLGRASKAKTNGPLVAALLELSGAAQALADIIGSP